MLGSVFSRTAQCSNCHIRDEAGNWKWQEWNRGGEGHALNLCLWSISMDSRAVSDWKHMQLSQYLPELLIRRWEKEKNRLTLIIWTKPPKSNIYVYHKTQHRKEQLKPAIMITENLEIKEWRTYTNVLDTIHKAHNKTKIYNVTSQLHSTQPQNSGTLYREHTNHYIFKEGAQRHHVFPGYVKAFLEWRLPIKMPHNFSDMFFSTSCQIACSVIHPNT